MSLILSRVRRVDPPMDIKHNSAARQWVSLKAIRKYPVRLRD